MLRILGSPKTLCNGVSRRELLQAGGIGTLGLTLDQLLRSREAQAAPSTSARSFGKAKSVILLFLYGSPSQLETFDVKPEAPEEIRGEFKTIPTVLPGYSVCELLPETAKIIDRTTVVRSMTHPYPIHGVAYATSGIPTIEVGMEVNPNDNRHWPFLGSVIDYLGEKNSTQTPGQAPRNVALPWPFSTRRTNQPHRAGPYAGFLGPAYHPVWTSFEGEGTVPFTQFNRGITQTFYDPYAGIKPDGRFELSAAGALPADMTLDRLNTRRSLLEQFDDSRRKLDSGDQIRSFDRFQGMAYSLLTSERFKKALDVHAEPANVRESYGMSLFGQAALAARRLVEAGTKLVSVFWDEYGLADSGWDTHYYHFERMRTQLCPSFDKGYSALIRDLEARGMLEDTIVLCISEHGRTPQLTRGQGGGRGHWSRAYSAIFAGGGFARGNIIGRSDRIASDVIDTPMSPKDILATTYHLLGIDPHTMIYDRLGRPLPIAGEGRVRPELLA